MLIQNTLRLRPFAITCGFLLAFLASSSFARSTPESFADLTEKLLPTVVNISSTSTSVSRQAPQLREFYDFFKRQFPNELLPFDEESQERKSTSLGSGFIISEEGYIVTNNHVIEGADKVVVTLHDNEEFEASVIGTDSRTDLALLKIDPEDYKLQAAKWGNSDTLRVGDWMVAIGNPFGLGNTVTAGIVSAKSRNINSGPYDRYIQTDASINRGNSGGPSFNMNGEVIGVNTAIFSPSGGSVGIGFAIPSALAQDIIEDLRNRGSVKRGWLGVRFAPVDASMAEYLGLPDERGAVINSVLSDTPASKAGLKPGDVIIVFNGQEIISGRDLPFVVAETEPGETIPVVIWRDQKEIELSVTIEQLSDEDSQDAPPAQDDKTNKELEKLGLKLTKLDQEKREKTQYSGENEGVYVESISRSSNFYQKGLRAGDIIVEVYDQSVNTPKDVLDRISEVKEKSFKIVALSIYRDGDYQWIAVDIDE